MANDNKPCPKCQENGHDSTGDHLWLMKDGKTWGCLKGEYHKTGKNYYEREGNSVGKPDEEEKVDSFGALLASIHGDPEAGDYGKEEPKAKEEEKEYDPDSLEALMGGTTPDPVPKPKQTRKEKKETHRKAATSGTKGNLRGPYRAISPEIYREYEVTGVYKGGDLSTLVHPIYEVRGSEIAQKYRRLPKEFGVIGTTGKAEVEFFGQRNARKCKTLVITEGEIDAMSIAESFVGSKYPAPAVVSLPFGANLKTIRDNHQFISGYRELVVCGDSDDAGEAFKREMASLYPKSKYMDLQEFKDANEMLQDGKKADLMNAFYKSEGYRPPSLANIKKLAALMSIPIKMGLTTPWSDIDEITYGLMEHSIVSIGAGPSIGKTEFIRALQQWVMEIHNEKVGIFSLEENPEATLRSLTGYIMGERINLPNAKYNGATAEATALTLDGKALIYDSKYFNRIWENILLGCRDFANMGARLLVIDPVSSLVTGQDSSDANTQLGVIMDDMTNLVKELPITIIMVNHLNDTKTGIGYSEGAWPRPEAFTGSRAQHRYSHFMLGLQRNTLSQDPDEKNTLGIQNIKCRVNGGLQGKKRFLSYNQNTGNFEKTKLTFA